MLQSTKGPCDKIMFALYEINAINPLKKKLCITLGFQHFRVTLQMLDEWKFTFDPSIRITLKLLIEPCREKTGFLPMRKQRRS